MPSQEQMHRKVLNQSSPKQKDSQVKAQGGGNYAILLLPWCICQAINCFSCPVKENI